MKRTFTFLLALLLLLQTTACASGNPETPETDAPAAETGVTASDETAAEETEAGLVKDDLPADLDFDGETVTIHIRNGDQGNPEGNCIMEMTVEELNGEILNDAIFNRNIAVNERLDVRITPYVSYDWTGYHEALNEIRASVNAGEDAYDIIAGWCNSELVSLAADGCFLDLAGAPYLDPEKPWWNQSLGSQNIFGGQKYFMTGEANILTSLGCAMGVFVNEKIASDYQLGNFADYVLEGTWTIDRMSEITEMVFEDLNGNNTKDAADRVGSVLTDYLAADAFYTSFDMHQIKIDNDGNVAYEPDMERIHDAVKKINDLHWNNPGGLGGVSNTAFRKIFLEGRALMSIDFIEASREELRLMEDSYYIIPTPKFDEKQERYYTYFFNDMTVLSVPVTNLQAEAAYATMEALSSESYFHVTPVFFEDCMQSKYARTEVTRQMLELIRETCYVDYEYVYGRLFNEPAFIFRNLVMSGSNDSASMIARNNKLVQKLIQRACDSFAD